MSGYRLFHTDEVELAVTGERQMLNISKFVSEFIMSACVRMLNFTEFDCCLGTLQTSVRKTDFFCPAVCFVVYLLETSGKKSVGNRSITLL